MKKCVIPIGKSWKDCICYVGTIRGLVSSSGLHFNGGPCKYHTGYDDDGCNRSIMISEKFQLTEEDFDI